MIRYLSVETLVKSITESGVECTSEGVVQHVWRCNEEDVEGFEFIDMVDLKPKNNNLQLTEAQAIYIATLYKPSLIIDIVDMLLEKNPTMGESYMLGIVDKCIAKKHAVQVQLATHSAITAMLHDAVQIATYLEKEEFIDLPTLKDIIFTATNVDLSEERLITYLGEVPYRESLTDDGVCLRTFLLHSDTFLAKCLRDNPQVALS